MLPLHPKEAIWDMAWGPSDRKFVTASNDCTVAVWDLERLVACAPGGEGGARELLLR